MNNRRYGWSLIELTIILIVLSILASILTPSIERYVRHARIVRAREDTQMLGMAMWMFFHDTGNHVFLRDGSLDPDLGASRADFGGSAPQERCYNRVNVLVGDGDIPQLGLDGDSRWVRRVNFEEVDFLEYHLITNRPGNRSHRRYRTPRDLDNSPLYNAGDPMFARYDSSGFNSMFAWRGPYISSGIDPDPWGNRYAANVGYLARCQEHFNYEVTELGFEYDVVVMTAGPDEEVDSLFEVDGLVPGDDDIVYTVSGNGP